MLSSSISSNSSENNGTNENKSSNDDNKDYNYVEMSLLKAAVLTTAAIAYLNTTYLLFFHSSNFGWEDVVNFFGIRPPSFD